MEGSAGAEASFDFERGIVVAVGEALKEVGAEEGSDAAEALVLSDVDEFVAEGAAACGSGPDRAAEGHSCGVEDREAGLLAAVMAEAGAGRGMGSTIIQRIDSGSTISSS